MASKVNVKFVVILSVALLALAAGVGVLGAMVLFKSAEDNIRRGDQFAAEGNYVEAAKSYGKAVNKENYNTVYLRKWADAVSKAIPPTDVEYRTMYLQQYLAALQQLAVVERANPQTQDDYLAATFRQLMLSGASGDAWGQFAERVTTALEGLDMSQPDAQRLLRYRGLAGVYRFRTLETVNQAERSKAEDDLAKALAADPNDIEAALARVELRSAEAMAMFRTGRAQESAARWDDATRAINDLAQRFPESPRVLLRRALMTAERAIQSAGSPAEQQAVSDALRGKLVEVIDATRGAPLDRLDEQFFGQLARSVAITGDKDLNRRWLALLDDLAAKAPDRAWLLIERGKALASNERYEDAIAQYEEVATKPDIPVSLDGLVLRQLRTEARRLQIESALALWSQASGEQREAAMARVKRYRESLAERVPADSPSLLRADAQVAFAERRLDDAVAALTQLRSVSGSEDSETLVMLGRALAAQGKTGAAAEQFRRVYERDPSNLGALITLIDLEIKSGNKQVARDLLDEAEKLAPDNPVIKSTKELLLVQQTGTADPNDPVLTILNSSLTLRTQNPPDYAQAIKLIDGVIPRYPNDVRLVLERAVLASQSEGREAAVAVIDRYKDRFPNNQRLAEIRVMLQYDDPVEGRLQLIDESAMSEVAKHIARASVLFQAGRSEQGDAELAKAKAVAPDDPLLLEIEFARSLERKDYDSAQRLAQRAAQLNSDGVQGQLFQARLELAQGKADSAAATLDRVTREDEYNVSAWRFLGSAQLQAGRIEDAIRAFDRALKIKPDDMPTVGAYIAALRSVRRDADALALARRVSELPGADSAVLSARLELEESVGDARYAIEQRARMRSANPGNRSNNLSLAQLLIREGRLTEAQEIVDSMRVESAEPDLGYALLEARLLAAKGDVDGAIQRVEREIERLPEARRGDGYVVLADFLFDRSRPEEAVQALERARGSQGPLMAVDRKLGDYYFGVGDYERAIAAYQRVVDAGADRDSVVLKRIAEGHVRLGQLDKADGAIASIVKASGDDAQTLLLKAQIALDRQNPLEARRLLDAAIEKDPRNALPFIRRAQLGFTDDSQFAAVQRDLRQAAQLQPDNVTVRQMLSQLYIRRGRVNEALDELAQAVRARPDNDSLRYEYIRLLGEQGTPEQMFAAIQQAVAERGKDAPQWYTLAGDALTQAGDQTRAVQLYERAYQVSNDAGTLARLVQAYLDSNPPKTQQASQAIAAFNATTPDQQYAAALLRARVEAAAGNSRPALQLLSQTWQQSGDSPAKTRLWFDQARAAFGRNQNDLLSFVQQLPSQTPSGMTPTAKVVMATLRAGDQTQTRAIFESIEGLEDEISDPATLLALARVRGQLAYVLGEYRAAADAYRLGLTVTPDDSQLNNNLAYTLAKHLDQPQAALAFATKAAEAAPLDANVLDTLGLIYLGLNRNTQAEATFQRANDAARQDLERVPILAHLAEAKKRTGDMAAAMNFARQAVQLGEVTRGAKELYSAELAEAGRIAAGR